jgi:hypothetical protein
VLERRPLDPEAERWRVAVAPDDRAPLVRLATGACSGEQIGQFARKRLWRQKVGTHLPV